MFVDEGECVSESALALLCRQWFNWNIISHLLALIYHHPLYHHIPRIVRSVGGFPGLKSNEVTIMHAGALSQTLQISFTLLDLVAIEFHGCSKNVWFLMFVADFPAPPPIPNTHACSPPLVVTWLPVLCFLVIHWLLFSSSLDIL